MFRRDPDVRILPIFPPRVPGGSVRASKTMRFGMGTPARSRKSNRIRAQARAVIKMLGRVGL